MQYGRSAERDRVRALLAAAHAGQSGALVLCGEAGIGKTTLLDHTVAHADMPVLRAVGVESESDLPFGALHQLLRPALALLDRLPDRQADTLRGAFGLASAEPADRFLVGAATLSLLSEYAGENALLIAVDDAHWLDRGSAKALQFAARRLDAEGIVMIFGARSVEPTSDLGDLPMLTLDGLSAGEAAELLAVRHPDLSPYVREQLVEHAGGNPLALLELASALTPDQRAGHLVPDWLTDGSVPIVGRVQAIFATRVRQLPARTRIVIQLAAADSTGQLDVILRAATASGHADANDLDAAERARLIRVVGHTVTFTHPLVRAAVLVDATFSERTARHRALAETLAGAEHRARRAWHRAAATTGTDDALATELAEIAAEASGRHGAVAASAAYERAAQLATADTGRARWLAAAARAAGRAGELGRAAALADEGSQYATEPAVLADIAEARYAGLGMEGDVDESVRTLVAGAGHITDTDPARAAFLLAQALRSALHVGDPQLIGSTAAALAALPHPLARYGRMLHEVPPALPESTDRPEEMLLAASFSMLTGADETTVELAASCVQRCRDTGTLTWLPAALTLQARAQLMLGHVTDAHGAATEALRIAEDTRLG